MRNIRLKTGGHRALFLALSLGAMFMLVMSGCQNPLTQRDAGTGTGTLSLSFGSGLARTILPEGGAIAPGTFDSFRLEFTAEGRDPHTVDWTGTGNIDVPAGTWNLKVVAIDGEGDYAEEVAEGTYTGVTIAPGQNTPVTVELVPIAEGSGTFRWEITAPAGVEAASLVIRPSDGITLGPAIDGIPTPSDPDEDGIVSGYLYPIPSGRYLVVFTLTQGTDSVELAAVLHVHRGMVSVFEKTVSPLAFPGTLLQFVANAWTGTAFVTGENQPDIVFGHFGAMGINGVTSGTIFNDIVARFPAMTGEDFPDSLDDLRLLVDAALIFRTISPPAWANINHFANRAAVEAAIRALAVNGTPATDIVINWGTTAEGTATLVHYETLTVTVGDFVSGTITFFDPEQVAPVESVTIDDATEITIVLTGGEGTAGPLSAIVYPPEAAPFATIDWKIDGDDVISVDADGYVIATGPGSATVRAVALGGAADGTDVVSTNYVAVTARDPILVSSVVIQRDGVDVGLTLALTYGDTPVTLTALVTPPPPPPR